MSTVPDKKTSKSRTKRRYAKWAYEKKKKLLERTKLVPCAQCKDPKLAHTVCATCGAYGSVKDLSKKNATKNVSTLVKKDSVAKKKATQDKKKDVKKPTLSEDVAKKPSETDDKNMDKTEKKAKK